MRIDKHPQDILVSRIYAANQENIRDHFLRLDFGSCRTRFCRAVSDNASTCCTRHEYRKRADSSHLVRQREPEAAHSEQNLILRRRQAALSPNPQSFINSPKSALT